MPRKYRYLIEFEDPTGLSLFESVLNRLDYTKMYHVDGLPGHPKYGLILHGTAKQMREVEKKLRWSTFDPYTFTCNRI